MTRYICSRCNWWGYQPYGSGLFTFDQDGGIKHQKHSTHCPICGNEDIKSETEEVEVWHMNQGV